MLDANNKSYCYNLTQNTCTRLVQIASRDIYKYSILPAQATLKLNVALAGNNERSILKSSQLFC